MGWEVDAGEGEGLGIGRVWFGLWGVRVGGWCYVWSGEGDRTGDERVTGL